MQEGPLGFGGHKKEFQYGGAKSLMQNIKPRWFRAIDVIQA